MADKDLQPELKAPPAENGKRSLVKKLAEVMKAVGWIEKGGYNEFHKYHYAQESDIVNALRGLLAERNIMIWPNVVDYKRTPHEVESYKGIRKTQLSEIIVEWTFEDGDSGETRTVRIPGVGEDAVDKGFYKAFTGSEKYQLMKTFLLPTGDDPEKDSKEDLKDAKVQGREAAQAVADRKIADYKASKAKEPPRERVTTLLYVFPEKHNGNAVEFLNIARFLEDNPDRVDEVRFAFSAVQAKKTKDDTALVQASKLPDLLNVLAGDLGISVHKLNPMTGEEVPGIKG